MTEHYHTVFTQSVGNLRMNINLMSAHFLVFLNPPGGDLLGPSEGRLHEVRAGGGRGQPRGDRRRLRRRGGRLLRCQVRPNITVHQFVLKCDKYFLERAYLP